MVKWFLEDLKKGEKIQLSYMILNETDDLSAAIYWSVKQISRQEETIKPEPVLTEEAEVGEFIPSLYTAIILLDTLIIIGSIFVFVQLRNYLKRR